MQLYHRWREVLTLAHVPGQERSCHPRLLVVPGAALVTAVPAGVVLTLAAEFLPAATAVVKGQSRIEQACFPKSLGPKWAGGFGGAEACYTLVPLFSGQAFACP